jgi:hypothetical protein
VKRTAAVYLGAAASAAWIGLLAGFGVDTAEILALAVILASGLAFHSSSKRRLVDALVLAAIAAALAALILAVALRPELETFGLGPVTPAATVAVSIAVLAPLAAALGLLACPPPLARRSAVSSVPGSAAIAALFYVVAVCAAIVASVAFGARHEDSGLIMHELREADLFTARSVIAAIAAPLIVWAGIRANRRRVDSRDWALPLAIAATVAIYAIHHVG